jgi:hypothetical protein
LTEPGLIPRTSAISTSVRFLVEAQHDAVPLAWGPRPHRGDHALLAVAAQDVDVRGRRVPGRVGRSAPERAEPAVVAVRPVDDRAPQVGALGPGGGPPAGPVEADERLLHRLLG